MNDTDDKTIVARKVKKPLPDVTRVVARVKKIAAEVDLAKTQIVTSSNSSAVYNNSNIVADKSLTAETPDHPPVGVGTVLKQRFELTELLGSGGMGSVYKARDLRQVEAGDQHPWVAVKVINESFARHEHALITLQQETKKTQRLAHPNIVSVYDFDREGNIAFMTMELLEGQPLDAVLARKMGGMPLTDALSIIRQISQAVAYAHKQGIVHADLKPANIFLAQDGRVRILDFGIAQAIKDDQYFDTQVLNALTPAYASVNMLAGQRPQPVDDLYALGCIFYLLLTGKHPFNRKRATEADAAQLKPARITQLKLHQWRALEQLLAFTPSAATSIERFQCDFFKEHENPVRRFYLRAGVAVVTLLLLWVATDYYLNQSVRRLAEELATDDSRQVQKAVQAIAELSGSDRVVVLEQARDLIAERIEQRLGELNNAQQFQQLNAYLQLIVTLYPDSSRVQDSQTQFAQLRQQFTDKLVTALSQRIEQRDFASQPLSFASQVNDLRAVAPEHPLFQQTQLKTLLAREAGVAVYLGQPDKAKDIVQQAMQLFPEDAARFKAIESRADKASAIVNVELPEQTKSDRRQSEVFLARELLNQYDLQNQPRLLADYLHALAASNSSLAVVLRQGLKDFFAQQTRQGNGKAFSDLQKSLFGAVPVVAVAEKAPVKLDPCSLRKANLGKQRGSRCRDALTASEQGPELVVISANGQKPFAITRSEISVSDFNIYCKLYRRCAPLPSSALPITNISLQQAQFYAQWLSRMTGYYYRLPTLNEWLTAATSDSGISDHNCIVMVSGRMVRGNQLRPVDQGYANAYGVLNVLGNAEEWVMEGSSVLVVGGAADTEINQCNIRYRNEKAPEEATPFRGLRLVRELK